MKHARLEINSTAFLETVKRQGYDTFLNKLIDKSEQEQNQINAWEYQLHELTNIFNEFPAAYAFLEFSIPRLGRRIDLVLLYKDTIFLIEYKVNSKTFTNDSKKQVYSYALDLKKFHSTSEKTPIIPILIATHAPDKRTAPLQWDHDQLAQPLCCNSKNVIQTIKYSLDHLPSPRPSLSPSLWSQGIYSPVPTIIEAARALYNGHQVKEISRSEAGEENISVTSSYIKTIIKESKKNQRKIICFVTGVPGAGKTLVGLDLATSKEVNQENHATFLSGNQPLIDVLQKSLYNDAKKKQSKYGIYHASLAEKEIDSFIQNIHHFRNSSLQSKGAPSEHIAIFDEAQRTWNSEQTTKFMEKRAFELFPKQSYLHKSEPEFLLSYMDRHQDWCAVICLIGEGQEINNGETGLSGWLEIISKKFSTWDAYLPELKDNNTILQNKRVIFSDKLHLSTSIRSFRAEKLSGYIFHILHNEPDKARLIHDELHNKYPLYITRNINDARQWLRRQQRGNEQIGLLANSNAMRLKPHGIFAKNNVEADKWFLSPPTDIRSSNMLEDVGTEFLVQGLELDWGCVCWDLNLRRTPPPQFQPNGTWSFHRFRGSSWQKIHQSEAQKYTENAYRVLLTRARQGLVIFVPPGDSSDETRPPQDYEDIYHYLVQVGFSPLPRSPSS